MSFRIRALEMDQVQALLAVGGSDARRVMVDQKPGFPCRLSLEDAEIGEEVLLVHFEHQAAATPFRASHAVYVRPGQARAVPEVNEVPAMLRLRMLSLRGFDGEGMLVAADLADGRELESGLETMFTDSRVEYIHVHFAKPGCYAARAERA